MSKRDKGYVLTITYLCTWLVYVCMYGDIQHLHLPCVVTFFPNLISSHLISSHLISSHPFSPSILILILTRTLSLSLIDLFFFLFFFLKKKNFPSSSFLVSLNQKLRIYLSHSSFYFSSLLSCSQILPNIHVNIYIYIHEQIMYCALLTFAFFFFFKL